LAIDFTAKDVLDESRETKGPWALAKAFDGATPISDFVEISKFPKIDGIRFDLNFNGEKVQTGNSSLMIFTLAEIIAYVSSFMTLNPGDIILSGTPAHGTGKVKMGDRLTGFLEGENLIDFEVQ
jgi:fumarylpyruvate hydrolase